MSETHEARLDVGHPAPFRDRVGWSTLAFILLAVPALWVVNLLAGFAFTSYLCFPGLANGVAPPHPGWLHAVVYAANFLALACALGGMAVSIMVIRRTRVERSDHAAGMLDAGEGRTRFLGVWGLFIGLLFFVAIAMNTIGMFLVPIC